MFLKLLMFHFYNLAIRKVLITYVTRIIFVLNSNALGILTTSYLNPDLYKSMRECVCLLWEVGRGYSL